MPSISTKSFKILINNTEKIERQKALQNNGIDRHIKKWKIVITNLNRILLFS